MKNQLALALTVLTLLIVPQTVFAQGDVDVGGNVLESPSSKIQEPVIGPPKAATKPAGPSRTTLVQIPEEEGGILFYRENKDFILGTIFGLEVLIIIFLIIYFHRRKKNRASNS